MTRDEVRAAAKRLMVLHQRFARWFGRKEAQEHSVVYLKGLMSDQQWKSVEPIALHFARGRNGAAATQKEVVALQGFITASPWLAFDVFWEIQAVFAEELMPTASQWSIGTVGVIDESGFVKRGTESVGVSRQWCGRLGKKENCQVGVFLTGVTPGGTAFLGARLFLPEKWIADRKRRRKTGVPPSVTFQSKPQIAADLIQQTLAGGKVRFDWIIADDLYGDSGDFLDALEGMQQRYLLEVRCTTLVWTVDPATLPSVTPGSQRQKKRGASADPPLRSVQEIAATLTPADWRPLKLREGSKGPLVFEFAVRRVWAMRHNRPGPPIWLVIRRSLGKAPQVWYYVSNAGAEMPWQQLAMVSGTRGRVEECFEDGKTHLGMADYETRSWDSWHHHMSLVALAHLYATLTKRDLKRNVPDLTLDMTVQLLRSAFARSELTEEEAMDLIDYHRCRNRIAHDSHRKTWLRKHKRIKPEVLL